MDVYRKIELTWGHDQHKMHCYGELLRAMLADQLVRDREHVRRLTGQNGRDSLAMAIAADRLARES